MARKGARAACTIQVHGILSLFDAVDVHWLVIRLSDIAGQVEKAIPIAAAFKDYRQVGATLTQCRVNG